MEHEPGPAGGLRFVDEFLCNIGWVYANDVRQNGDWCVFNFTAL